MDGFFIVVGALVGFLMAGAFFKVVFADFAAGFTVVAGLLVDLVVVDLAV